MGIRGGKVKSVKALKASTKRGGNNGGLKRVPKDEPMIVRFLTEPDEWFEFYEHYDETNKRFVVCADDCDYCADDVRTSKRVLAPVLDTAEGKVEPLALPTSLVSRLLNKYDKYSTMTDRDYELIRTGDGLDTEYDVTPEAPTKMRLSRFEVPDLQEILESLSGGDDEDEEEDEKPKRRPASRKPDPDDDEDEDDDDDDDEFLRPRRGRAVKPKSSPSSSLSKGRSSSGRTVPVKPRKPGGLRK